jgi:polyphosphate kinase 2 (PPK2 family)
MGFVREDDYKAFLKDVPVFEKMLVDSGTTIVKFYFSVSKTEQARRFEGRKSNPLKQFKLSPIDQYSQQLWDKYTLAEYKNLSATHSKHAPWTIVNSDDKKLARINAIKHVLNQFEYPDKIDTKLLKEDPKIVISGEEKAKALA